MKGKGKNLKRPFVFFSLFDPKYQFKKLFPLPLQLMSRWQRSWVNHVKGPTVDFLSLCCPTFYKDHFLLKVQLCISYVTLRNPYLVKNQLFKDLKWPKIAFFDLLERSKSWRENLKRPINSFSLFRRSENSRKFFPFLNHAHVTVTEIQVKGLLRVPPSIFRAYIVQLFIRIISG